MVLHVIYRFGKDQEHRTSAKASMIVHEGSFKHIPSFQEEDSTFVIVVDYKVVRLIPRFKTGLATP